MSNSVDARGNHKMGDVNKSHEQAKQLVQNCPRGYWIVDDLEHKTVYYKNQKPPHDTIPTDHTTNDVLIAHQVFIPPADTYHIALDQHNRVNANHNCLHYSPVW
jgi:ferredoxin-like protein FixX